MLQSCSRKMMFEENFQLQTSNEFALRGIVCHKIFEKGLKKEKSFTYEDINTYFENIMEEETIKKDIKVNKMKKEDLYDDTMKLFKSFDFSKTFSEEVEVVDIEELVYSKKYGVKGQFDAVFKINKELLPFELKSGENKTNKSLGKIEHTAQTLLYLLLLSERHNQDVTRGIIYYMKSNTKVIIEYDINSIIDILKNRNNFVYHFKRKEFPKMTDYSETCKYCNIKSICMTFYKSIENGKKKDIKNKIMIEEYEKIKLNENEMNFIKKYYEEIIKNEEKIEDYQNINGIEIFNNQEINNLRILKEEKIDENKFEYILYKSDINFELSFEINENIFLIYDKYINILKGKKLFLYLSGINKLTLTLGSIKSLNKNYMIIILNKKLISKNFIIKKIDFLKLKIEKSNLFLSVLDENNIFNNFIQNDFNEKIIKDNIIENKKFFIQKNKIEGI
jgi:CRISPR-associated protein Cas4